MNLQFLLLNGIATIIVDFVFSWFWLDHAISLLQFLLSFDIFMFLSDIWFSFSDFVSVLWVIYLNFDFEVRRSCHQDLFGVSVWISWSSFVLCN
jgi:hypothetical protein